MSATLTKYATVPDQLSMLGSRADVLQYLPFNSVVFGDQHQVSSAYSTTMLFGSTKRKPGNVWIYWSKSNLELKFHSSIDNDRTDSWLIAEEVV